MKWNKNKKNNEFLCRFHKSGGGVTLIEIMVSMSIFIIIMLISSGSILSVFDANNKSKNLRAVMDNLNIAVESMTRTIRFGNTYHCDILIVNPLITSPRDCDGGATSIALKASDGTTVIYKWTGNTIERSTDFGVNYNGLVSSD